MISFIKNSILARKQNLIRRRYPDVNIVFHPEMPLSSVNKMVEVAPIVDAVNKLEPKIKNLTDLDLRKKTDEFSEYILRQAEKYQSEIEELEKLLLSAVMPQERGNVEFVREESCGLIARRLEEIPSMVQYILNSRPEFTYPNIYGTDRIGEFIIKGAEV